MSKRRIALLQMAPELGQIEKNKTKILELTTSLQPGGLDLLCLPEMILTGYAFPSADAIRPYLEKPRVGPTSRFCSDLAKMLRCHVMAGYPEAMSQDEESASDGAIGYNSAVVYGPDGEWQGGYRKTNLFFTDMTWASPGAGFGLFELGSTLNRVSLGICMDLNPQPPSVWTSAEGPYELASFALDNNTRLLVILCAWLDSRKDPDDQWDRDTVAYWAARLRPLWGDSGEQTHVDDTIVAICNRAGQDEDTLFAGTSALLRCSRKEGSVEIVGLMRRKEEGVRLWEI